MAEASRGSSSSMEGQLSQDDETQQNIPQNINPSVHHARPQPYYPSYPNEYGLPQTYPNEYGLPQTYPTPHRINPIYEQHHYYRNQRLEPRPDYNYQFGQVPYYYPRQTEQFVSSYRINYAGEGHHPMELRGHQSFQNRFPLHQPQMNVPYPYYHHASRPNDGGGYWPNHREHPDLPLHAERDLYQNPNFSHRLPCACHECNSRYSRVQSAQYSTNRYTNELIDHPQFPHTGNFLHKESDKNPILPNQENSQCEMMQKDFPSYQSTQNTSSTQKDDQTLTAQMFLKYMESMDSKIKKLEDKLETYQSSDSVTSDIKHQSDEDSLKKPKKHVKGDNIKKPMPYIVSEPNDESHKTGESHANFNTNISNTGQSSGSGEEEETFTKVLSGMRLVNPMQQPHQGGCKPKSCCLYNQRMPNHQDDIATNPWNSIKEFAKECLFSKSADDAIQGGIAMLTNEIGNVLQTPVFADDTQELEQYARNTTKQNFSKAFGSVILDVVEKEFRSKVKPDTSKADSVLTGLRNFVEKLLFHKCSGSEFLDYLVDDYFSLLIKENEGLDFLRKILKIATDSKDDIPTEHIMRAYETTRSGTKLNKSLDYKNFCSSQRIIDVTPQIDNFDETEAIEDCPNDEELINENLDDIFDNGIKKDFPNFVERDEDTSSNESYHTGEEDEPMDIEYSENLSTLQLIATLENTNNPKYSNGIAESTIRFLGKNLSDPQCRQLVKHLGLTQRRIEDTEIEQGPNASREEIREKWIVKCREKHGRALTNNGLIKALFNVGRADLVNHLFPDFIKDNPDISREIFYMGKIKLSFQEYKIVLRKMQLCLKAGYAKENVFLPTTPWLQHKILHLDELYVDLKMFPKNNNGFEDTGKEIKLQDIFLKLHGEYPYRILVEGPPGYGKTTFTFKLAVDWAKNEIYLKRFHLVFIIALRYFHGDLEEVMVNECKVENIPDIVKLSVIKRYQKHVLLILDGYDELSDDHKASLISLLKGENYSAMTVLLTSRTGLFKLPMKEDKRNQFTGGYVEMINQSGRHNSFWKKRIEIKGISPEKRKLFLQKYLQIDVNNLYRKLAHVMSDEMKNLYECPLVLLLLAMLVEEKGVEQISSKTDLYKQVVNFIVRRSLEKQSLIPRDKEVDLFGNIGEEFYFDLIIKLGEYSLQKLTQHTLMFREDEILEHCNNDETVLKLGFLTKNIKLLNHEESEFYEPVHKTFLEFLAAFRLWYLHQESENGRNNFNLKISSLIKQKILDQKDSLLFIFLSGLLEEQSNILLETLNSWNYNMSAYEYPISDIVKESQCMKKLLPYITPFIPPIFQHHYDFFTNAYNWLVFKAGIHHRQIKVLNVNAHHLVDFPNMDYAEVIQLDIWGKDVENELTERKFSISCKDLICWFYGITKKNWNYYANVVQNINAEHVSLVVNAYDDYNQLQLILSCIKNELKNGQWQHLNIKYLKVLGLDGKNDRQSLNLIGSIVNTNMIKKGLIVVIKSIVGALETLSFWFKTRFLKSLKEEVHKFHRQLQFAGRFKEYLRVNYDKIVSEINDEIKKISTTFHSTLRNLEKTINFDSEDTSYDSEYERGDVIRVPYKKGVTEEKIKWFAEEIQRNGNEFLRELASLLKSSEKNMPQLRDSFQEEILDKFEGFCKLLHSAETHVTNDDDGEDSVIGDESINLNKFIKYTTYIVQNCNPFKTEMEKFLNTVSQSGLVHFTLNNGYCNTMHLPSLDPRKCFRNKEWEVLQLGDKIVIDDSYYKAVGEYRINDLALTDGREKYAEKDVSAILKCNALQSLSSTTMLLKKLQSTEKEDWKGFTTLKKLDWILDQENFHEDDLQLLENFKSLENLSINFGCISEKFNFAEFPRLRFQSLKTLELIEVDYENIDFVKDLTRSLLSKGMDQRFAENEDDEKAVIRLLELKLDLSKVFDEKDIEEIYDIAKELLMFNIIRSLSLIDPNEYQYSLIMKIFSIINEFKISKTFEGSDNIDTLICQPEKSYSTDIQMQLIICKV